MARKDHVCPIMKKTCIGCSVYRGRHMGLWTGEEKSTNTAHVSGASSGGSGSSSEGSGWINSFDAFVKNVAGPEVAFDWD